MPVAPQNARLEIGHVVGAHEFSQANFMIEIDEHGSASVLVYMHEPKGRGRGVLMRLGERQYADLWNVLRATHDTLERLKAAGQARQHAQLP